HPLRERLRGQLMLSLYRSGRQADALEAYRSGRLLLAEQLALDPTVELRRLEQAILRQDESLQLARPPGVAVAPPAPAEPAAVREAAAAAEPRALRERSGRRWLVAVITALVAAAATTGVALTRHTSPRRQTGSSLKSLPPGVAIISAADGSLVS